MIAVLAMLPVLLSGCMPTAGESDSTGSQVYVKNGVVKGFVPMPLYPKAQPVESYNFNSNMGASFISGDSLAKVVNFYSKGLTQIGWEQNLYKQSDSSYIFQIKGVKYQGEVVVNTASDGKKTAISVFVFPRN